MKNNHKFRSFKTLCTILFGALLMLGLTSSPKTASAKTLSVPSIITCLPESQPVNAGGIGQSTPDLGLIQPMCEGSYTGEIIAGREVSPHASLRMNQRGFDRIMVESILTYGQKFNDTYRKSYIYVQKGASGQARMIATNYAETEIKTVMIGYPPTTTGRMRSLPY